MADLTRPNWKVKEPTLLPDTVTPASPVRITPNREGTLSVNQSETWSPSVTFIRGRYTESQVGFVFPNFSVGGLSYVGANAQFVVEIT